MDTCRFINSARWSCVKSISAAFSSLHREFTSPPLPSSSPRIYRTLAFLSSLLSCMCRAISQSPNEKLPELREGPYSNCVGGTVGRTRIDSFKVTKYATDCIAKSKPLFKIRIGTHRTKNELRLGSRF